MTNPFRTDLIALLVRRGHKGKEIVEMVREIEALLDSQRCEWEHDIEGDWRTGCKAWFAYDYSTEDSFCPCCGKRIEVKDEQG